MPGRIQLTDELRRRFETMLDEAIWDLPADLQQKLEEVFVNAQDQPDRALMRKMGIARPEQLRGLYTGVPQTRRSLYDSGRLPDTIVLFRLGIVAAASDSRGRCSDTRLRAQIRKTLLHEIGHHFGMDEDDLAGYGYG
jgi:predicted Zn-dependent protease with MMP-like domain